MIHLMFDLETMGKSSRAAIVQIAAAEFDIRFGHIIREISINVDLQSSIDAGLEVDASTIEFWLLQPEESRTWSRGEKLTLREALESFSLFCDPLKGAVVWSHSTFDPPILNSAYQAIKKEIPFNYRNAADLRTVWRLTEGVGRLAHNGIKHDALSDCRYQIGWLVDAIKSMGGWR